ncbi:nuclear transport factor 2 family protein [Nocardia huaxiensis]|uniref:Nuclear transport factor 2 family protein n=1 Tax=Nocardia huaxiensis TaxID=2755382 RepID=A0A7D6VKU4_9NOCA|nr:nuclear transport factor 2 family protein [Nocardia huaxiensis]QLY32156.1 nuclear transport factor 2 family protein [Nocardia huaxiensis]UFS94144.1 nuclear transport factor 2 family protein [Nocardia huaxiensis]
MTQLDRTVQKFVDAVNSHDVDAFFETLTADASMSDDGAERNLAQWTDSEIFATNGHMKVESVGSPTEFVADYSNDRWGSMRTAWRFTVRDGLISRFETGQA